MQALHFLRTIKEGGCSGNPFHIVTEKETNYFTPLALFCHAPRLDNTSGLALSQQQIGGGAVRLPYLDGNTDLVQSCINSCSAASQ